MSGDIGLSQLGESTTGVYRGQDAAQHPTMYRTLPDPEGVLAPNESWMGVDKPWGESKAAQPRARGFPLLSLSFLIWKMRVTGSITDTCVIKWVKNVRGLGQDLAHSKWSVSMNCFHCYW